MASALGRIEIEKFDDTNFELWKLKVEDMMVDRDLWIVVSGNNPLGIKQEDWVSIDRKSKGLIRLCLVDFVVLNVHEEKIVDSLWKKLGDIY